MAYLLYSYPIGRVVPLLEEHEWAVFAAYFNGRIPAVSAFQRETGCTNQFAVENEPSGRVALAKYHDMTGGTLSYGYELMSVRLADYGAPCPKCAKPFRTPRARHCMACGFALPKGTVAGPVPIAAVPHLKVGG